MAVVFVHAFIYLNLFIYLFETLLRSDRRQPVYSGLGGKKINATK